MTNTTKPKNVYSVIWERPCGRFGFTTIEECATSEDAAAHFFDYVQGRDPQVPADAELTSVRLVSSS